MEFQDGGTKSLPCVPGFLLLLPSSHSWNSHPFSLWVMSRGVSKADPFLATLTPTFLHLLLFPSFLFHIPQRGVHKGFTSHPPPKPKEFYIFPLINEKNPLVPAAGDGRHRPRAPGGHSQPHSRLILGWSHMNLLQMETKEQGGKGKPHSLGASRGSGMGTGAALPGLRQPPGRSEFPSRVWECGWIMPGITARWG